MIDPKTLRYKIHDVAKKLKSRNFYINIDFFQKREEKRKKIQIKLEKLQKKRNFYSKKIGLERKKKKYIKKKLLNLFILKKKITEFKKKLSRIKSSILYDISRFPNIPDPSVPVGKKKKNNIEISRWGTPRKYDFAVRSHIELGKKNKEIDFSVASKMTGSKFVVIRGEIARLHRALSQFMLDIHIEKYGYQEHYLPYLVNSESLFGSGQLPKFSQELFNIEKTKKNQSHSFSLIPTAEVPLINLVRNSIIEKKRLPLKFVAHTPCFRLEAGSYGKKCFGLMRLHQFEKIEIVQIANPKNSMNTLEEITNHAEKILRLLNIPYRKILLCTGKMGFSSCKTYDLEAWFPAKSSYYEVSSCSNTGDFQSRRINARLSNREDHKEKFVHILNGSGLAVGRTLAAILENFQKKNGSIEIPPVLSSYLKHNV